MDVVLWQQMAFGSLGPAGISSKGPWKAALGSGFTWQICPCRLLLEAQLKTG